MATVTTGIVPHDSEYVANRISLLTDLQAGVVPNGFTVQRSPTQIQYATPDGTVLIFAGTGFTFNPAGALTAGNLASITETVGGQPVFSITTFSFSVANPVSFSAIFAGADTVTGGGSDGDFITGGNGNNTLNGGGGADDMAGGSGNDLFVVDNVGDFVGDPGGIDTVQSSVNFSLSGNQVDALIENLTLTGTATSGTGDNLDNTITGNASNNVLNGMGGNDTLDGGAGIDTLAGGAGSDTYVYDGADTLIELLGEGDDDLVRSSVNFDLSNPAFEHFEHVTLTGAGAINATGDGGDNELRGNNAANVLNGGAGEDAMFGGGGNDTYVFDDDDDEATEVSPAGGTDTVISSVNIGFLNNFIENATLTGGAINVNGNTLANTLTGNALDNSLNGQGGNDTMAGGLGNDEYLVDQTGDAVQEGVGAGNDTVFFASNAQLTSYTLSANVENLVAGEGGILGVSLTGNDLANNIEGTDGNDSINGAAGADTMEGFDGHDTYFVDNAGDAVIEQGLGIDTVQSSIDLLLGEAVGFGDLLDGIPVLGISGAVENLTLTGAALLGGGNDLANVVTGNGLDNTLFGFEGDDTLDGGLGNDTMIGGDGDDTYVVNAAGPTGDLVIEEDGEEGGIDTVRSSVTFSIEGDLDLEDITLTGNAVANATGNGGANNLVGNDGANILDGKAGADDMSGGLGADTYFVDSTEDTVTETTAGAAGGVDTVNSLVSFELGANVENLNLGGAAFGGYGNDIANIIRGTDGDNMLGGGGGVDSMTGYGGNDIYVVDVGGAGGDAVVEAANGGFDTVFFDHVGGAASYTLAAEVERLVNTGGGNVTLVGNGLANEIVVEKDDPTNDTLDGGAGADTMEGADGNDLYMVDNADDSVFDSEGLDRVSSSVSFSLEGTGVENLTLTGTTTAAAVGTGSEADNEIIANLSGAALANMLTGEGGDDTLNGGLGNDTMIGGDGDDSYFVDNAGDVVVENFDQGDDTVNSSVTYTLTPDVEDLVLTGSAAINGTGNDLVNNIFGNAGNNILNGGAGADEMTGGLGGDTYHVDDEGDSVVETVGGLVGGIDLVRSTVTFDLALHSAFLEVLVLVGTTPADSEPIDGFGNDLANKIDGNAAANLLDGRKGADTLAGYGGDDIYRIDHAGDVIVAVGNEVAGAAGGTDTVEAAVSFVLGANLENLTLLEDTAALNATGNDLVNVLVGNGNNNRLDGMGAADIMAGGFGDDTYIVGNGAGAALDTVLEEVGAGTADTVISSVSYGLGENLENLTLIGAATSGTGNEANNIITAIGATATALAGLDGDDLYIVDGTNDVVTELVGNGTLDEIRSSVSYTLAGGSEVEILTLTGAALNATGNGFNNTLVGTAAANDLNGMGGVDVMIGGAGNDTYRVDDTDDDVVESGGTGGGIDTVRSTATYILPDNPGLDSVENLILEDSGGDIDGTGNDARNTLTGNLGDNDLDGGAGADTMIGRAGNDNYFVDNAGDRVDEVTNGGAGTDRVESSVSYTLSAGVENLTLVGAALNGRGNALVNELVGNGSNNYLNGEGGADTMEGAAGNDTYVVDNAGDLIVEVEGDLADQVLSSVTIDFSTGALNDEADIENITLTGANAINATGNDLDNDIDGNSAINTLNGGDGDDELDGKGGADIMNGGSGNDLFHVDNVGDKTLEAAGEGGDEVQSTVSYTLEAGSEIEFLSLVGNRNINGTGNDEDQLIQGNGGNNVLNGMGGEDDLVGQGGNDVLIWDSADDQRDGGDGFDTLRVVGGGQNIVAADEGLVFIDRIDLNLAAGGDNSLTVTTADVLDMLDDGVTELFVTGNGLDEVFLDATVEGWVEAADQVRNGILYNVYNSADGPDVSVLIQDGITISVVA